MWNIFLAIATGTCKFLTFYSPFTRVKATSKLNKKWVLQGLLLTMFPYIPLIPCSLSDPRMFLLNANFSTCKLIIVKIHKKDIPFFHWEGFFFWKQVFILALMILVYLFSLAVSNIVLYTCFFNEPVYDVLVPWKKKKIWTSCTFFFLCFVHFKCYYFCL